MADENLQHSVAYRTRLHPNLLFLVLNARHSVNQRKSTQIPLLLVLIQICYIHDVKAKVKSLPIGQMVPHVLFCVYSPSHTSPPMRGAGLVQVRRLNCTPCPGPQVTLHSSHSPHSLKLPLADGENKEQYDFTLSCNHL